MDKKRVEPTPDNFESYEAAADFWDTDDTTNYLDEFRTVEVNTELRARHLPVARSVAGIADSGRPGSPTPAAPQ